MSSEWLAWGFGGQRPLGLSWGLIRFVGLLWPNIEVARQGPEPRTPIHCWRVRDFEPWKFVQEITSGGDVVFANMPSGHPLRNVGTSSARKSCSKFVDAKIFSTLIDSTLVFQRITSPHRHVVKRFTCPKREIRCHARVQSWQITTPAWLQQ